MEPPYLSQLSAVIIRPSLLLGSRLRVTCVQVAPKGCASEVLHMEHLSAFPSPSTPASWRVSNSPGSLPVASSASKALSQIFLHGVPLHPFEVLTQILPSLQSHRDPSFKIIPVLAPSSALPCFHFFPQHIHHLISNIFYLLTYCLNISS